MRLIVVVSRRRCLLLVLGGAPFLCSLLRLSLATVVLNSISASFPDLPAKFDGSVTKNGICGALYVADPLDGCSPLLHAATSNNNLTQQQRTRTRTNFALIIRGECSFEDKLLNAQKSGFRAVIVYDNFDNQDLVVMKVNPQNITVVAVFVSNVAGEILSKYARGRDGECCLYPPTKGSAWTVLAISFFSLLLILTFLLLAFFAPRHWTLWRRGTHNRTIRVDANLVHSLPSFTFTTDSSSRHNPGDTCPICLEDYISGESLRLLPCQHAFHLSCIDSWLTKWGTSCPVCKHDISSETFSSEVHKRECPRTDTSTSRFAFAQSSQSH
ncbi:PREDICTED: receptor homology region, transmembrane domain- and RING domain-containing protein 1 [Camelina sativa]|uniref:Receptor homology region, transmembrane domain- and RING domain-containing protein 1 n=1 Tax=Camelina sativa TaxID=90675 RepID=A0ABM0XEE0_CAMSA|nr:PREDICTED: receptor homology region, transmembrane domain- and RING domain-containing protein 1 [Camelina sativa]